VTPSPNKPEEPPAVVVEQPKTPDESVPVLAKTGDEVFIYALAAACLMVADIAALVACVRRRKKAK
jgi:hypothetical protein